jgi:hypothetical protein
MGEWGIMGEWALGLVCPTDIWVRAATVLPLARLRRDIDVKTRRYYDQVCQI